MYHPTLLMLLATVLSCPYAAPPGGLPVPHNGCDSIPALNQKIIGFVTARVGATVGRGECWDLAAEALNSLNAEWDKKYRFGREIDFRDECVYPGDIIQFEKVKVKYREGNRQYEETMYHHTAIIREVKGKGLYILAHQNTAFSGRKVGLSDLDLKNITKGKFKIYRPVK